METLKVVVEIAIAFATGIFCGYWRGRHVEFKVWSKGIVRGDVSLHYIDFLINE
jgi:hypothetical protein